MSNEEPGQVNPYDNRSHDNERPLDRGDAYAIAGLLGQVGGSLGEIDKQQVGSDSANVKAQKMDPKVALQTIVGASGVPPGPSHPQPQPRTPVSNPSPIPVASPTPPIPVASPTQPIPIPPAARDVEHRLVAIEKFIDTYSKVTKFKRGISYTVNTLKIKGEFRDPLTVLDIISAEMAKGAKSITLKLNDTTKSKK